MGRSRVKNTVRNSIVGMGGYVLSAVMSFVGRMVFIRQLGVEYLGVAGLYSNILSVLALSDLGLYTVMVYSLYKPLAEEDHERISVLIRFYKKLYLIVAAAVTGLGLLCVPFLPFLVKDTALSNGELVVYYLLILANSVSSYFAISKTTLIRADQHANIIQGVTSASTFCMHLTQMLLLLVFQNYTLYLTLPILFTLLQNLILTKIADKKYPYLKSVNKALSVDREVKASIWSNLKATFLYKFGNTLINSTANILISVLLGTVIVGYYNNYYAVITLVNGVLSILITSVLASIGNFNATQTPERKFELFKALLLVFYIIGGFCAACYFAIFDDFISFWIGREFVLDDAFLIALVVKCTVICISNPLWMVRESSGVFTSVRYVMLVAAGLNIVISIVAARFLGLAGIFWGTSLAHLLTLFWYEPKMLCKLVFHVPSAKYWQNLVKLIFAMLPGCFCGWLLHSLFTTNVFFMALKVLLCALATGLSFFALFYKTSEFRWMLELASKLLKKKKVRTVREEEANV